MCELETGARDKAERYRDVQRCFVTGYRTGSQKLRIPAPKLLNHGSTIPPTRYRAFDVLQGSCYTHRRRLDRYIPTGQLQVIVSFVFRTAVPFPQNLAV